MAPTAFGQTGGSFIHICGGYALNVFGPCLLMMGTGGEFLELLDPNDEILWKDVGLFIPDEALRSKFGVGGSNVHGVSNPCNNYPCDVAQPGILVPLESSYERDILAIIDECHTTELNIPRVSIPVVSHKQNKP